MSCVLVCAPGGAEGLLGAKGFEAPAPLEWEEGGSSSSGGEERSGAAADASTSGRGYAEAERRFRGCVFHHTVCCASTATAATAS